MPRISHHSLRPRSGQWETSARRSLSLALLLTVGVGVVLTLGLIGIDQRARLGQEREALVQQAARANKLASELAFQLHASEQLVNTLASLAGPIREQRDLEELLRRMLDSTPEDAIYGLGVWFEPERFTPGVRYLGPYVHRNLDEPGGPPILTYEWSTPAYDYHRQPWYQLSRKLGGRISLSEPYVEDLEYESLTRAFFDDQGRLRGVVSVDIHLPQVRELVHQANSSDSERLYVVSPGGALIAHPDEEQLLAWARERGHPVRWLGELTVADLRTWEDERGLGSGWHTAQLLVPEAGWKVFVSTDERMLFAKVNRHVWLLVALGLVLWAGLGASGMAMARSARIRNLLRTLTERQRQEEERQRLLAEVRQRSAELQAVLESMVDAVTVVDTQGNVTLANRASLMLLGKSSYEGDRVDITYQALGPVQDLEGREVPLDSVPLARALRGEQVSDTDLVINVPRLGRKLVVRLNAAPIRDEAGHVVAAVAVTRDITQAIELERFQGELASMAAHELKTPLAVMKSFAQLALRTGTPSPALCRLLEGIHRGVDRMDRVVRTLLDASQLQLDQLRFETEEMELRALVESAAARTAADHPRNPIHVRPGPQAWVRGDPARLEQVLLELMDNAARYSPPGGPVEVSLTLEGGEVELCIHDEGIGIPEDRRERLFERFYRAHAGTPHDRGGMGLGLYLSRGIILRHGGRMELESREGEGTHVSFRLPRLLGQHPTPGMTVGGSPSPQLG